MKIVNEYNRKIGEIGRKKGNRRKNVKKKDEQNRNRRRKEGMDRKRRMNPSRRKRR